ncbi:MAG: methylated-DNA--[protein]-cysteine S-methyltransferase [Actinomycetes bacterium]
MGTILARPTTMAMTTVPSALGDFVLIGDATTLIEIRLPSEVTVRSENQDPQGWLDDAARQLTDYLAGERTSFDLATRSQGTPFQEHVWAALDTIAYGEVRSYGWIADAIGRPASARPVGQALGRNPLPIIRPCHRVVASEGIGGYGGGLVLKRHLLEIEGVSALAI